MYLLLSKSCFFIAVGFRTPAPFYKAGCVCMQGVVEPCLLPQTMGADGLQGGVNVGRVKTDICKKERESVAFHFGKLTVYFG